MDFRSFFLSLFKGVPRENYDSIFQRKAEVESDLQEAVALVENIFHKDEMEDYLTNKYPKVEKLYGARPIPPLGKRILVDPRVFLTPYDSKLQKIVRGLKLEGLDDDEKVYKCFLWVRKNIQYKYDKDNFGSDEYWSFPFETLYHKKGDCDSQSILLANLCLVAKVPYCKLRITVGPVEGGYHAFLTYYVESKKHWCIMDVTYWTNSKKPADRPNYKDETKYFEKVWFSFDQKYVYQKGHKTWVK